MIFEFFFFVQAFLKKKSKNIAKPREIYNLREKISRRKLIQDNFIRERKLKPSRFVFAVYFCVRISES